MVSSQASGLAAAFARAPLPRLCNLDRLLHAMKARDLDGVVASLPYNVFYLTSFNGIAHKADEPRPYAVVLSRHAPEHPILVIADYYLATFLTQPTWVEDVRPFRAVMMPLDLPPERTDIDRFIPKAAPAYPGSSTPARATPSIWAARSGALLPTSGSTAPASRSTIWPSAFVLAWSASRWPTVTMR